MSDQYYTQVSALAANIRHFSLKREQTFLLCNRRGELRESVQSEMGLYWEGTRFLSQYEAHMSGDLPVLLSSFATRDDSQLLVTMTNADIVSGGTIIAPRESIIVRQEISLGERQLYVRLRATNFHFEPLTLRFDLLFGADFRDIFEVRGMKRAARGEVLPPEVEGGELVLAYIGLDGIRRETRVHFDPAPETFHQGRVARYARRLARREEFTLETRATASVGGAHKPLRSLSRLRRHAEEEMEAWHAAGATVRTSNEAFNAVLDRAFRDIHMLRTTTDLGPYPYAGLPWYAVPFGRDGIITCLEMLPYQPQLAEGCLNYLAHHQGRREEPFTDEEPGKILHEHRRGEMANLREIPFIPYYGTVDATPLFIILLAEYVQWTGNMAKLRELWPARWPPSEWIDALRRPRRRRLHRVRAPLGQGAAQPGLEGLLRRVMHADGELAEPPDQRSSRCRPTPTARGSPWPRSRCSSERADRGPP